MQDRIRICEITVDAIIGTLPHERHTPQKLIVSADLYGDFRAAGRTDDFNLTFDYSQAERMIFDFVSASSYQLLEALAEHLAEHLLTLPCLEKVSLSIRKPGAPQIARDIVLEIERSKQEKTGKTPDLA